VTLPQHVGDHQARVHAVHPDAAVLGLGAQRFGELPDPALARCVGVLQRHRPLVTLAVDVDEVTVALAEEHRQRDPRTVERAEDVRAHDPREILDWRGRRGSVDAGGAGVVDPDVEGAVRESLLTQRFDIRQLSHVAATSGRLDPLGAQPFDGGRDIGVRPGRQHHRRAVTTQHTGHREAQPAR